MANCLQNDPAKMFQNNQKGFTLGSILKYKSKHKIIFSQNNRLNWFKGMDHLAKEP